MARRHECGDPVGADRDVIEHRQGVLEPMQDHAGLASQLPVFIPGFLASAITGYLAIRWLLRFLIHHTLYDFAIYCVGAGLVTVIISYTR